MKITAKIISILFHPIIIPTLGILLLFNTNSYLNYVIPREMKMAILLLVVMNTLFIPFFISLTLLFAKKIKSFIMETNKERIIPYAFTIVFYTVTLLRLYKEPIPPIIFKFLAGATTSVILAFIINFKWKISAHMIGIGGLLGALITVSLLFNIYILPLIALIFLIAGLLGASRLILGAHNHMQIYAGFLLGFLCQVGVIYF